MSETKRVAIIGATGYTGQELTRILLGHGWVRIAALTSRKNLGVDYAGMFPAFQGYGLPAITKYDPQKTLKHVDLAFFCLPHGESRDAVGGAVDKKVKVVDLSADFRLKKPSEYRRWYGEHSRPELLKEAVYGLPELYRDRIRRASLVANPGCYPTGVILGVSPLLKAKAASADHVIADMKSGVSGAGRKASIELSYCEANEGMRPYNLYAHRHTGEMEQELSKSAGKKVRVTFSPHLAPFNRGILGTIYVSLARRCKTEDLIEIIALAYEDEPFVRVLPPGLMPCVSRVRGTNFVDIAAVASPSGREAIISTAIDNLVKGASGAAVQNMNLMLDLPEGEALLAAPLRP